MGTMTSVLGTVTQTLGALETLSSTVDTLNNADGKALKAQQELAMTNLKQQQSLSEAEAKQAAETEKQEIALAAAQEEKDRLAALRKALATQNASRGASGISSSGSTQALLQGLADDAEEESDYANSLDQIRYNTIEQNLENLQAKNLLEQSQLAAQQKLERAVSGY